VGRRVTCQKRLGVGGGGGGATRCNLDHRPSRGVNGGTKKEDPVCLHTRKAGRLRYGRERGKPGKGMDAWPPNGGIDVTHMGQEPAAFESRTGAMHLLTTDESGWALG